MIKPTRIEGNLIQEEVPIADVLFEDGELNEVEIPLADLVERFHEVIEAFPPELIVSVRVRLSGNKLSDMGAANVELVVDRKENDDERLYREAYEAQKARASGR